MLLFEGNQHELLFHVALLLVELLTVGDLSVKENPTRMAHHNKSTLNIPQPALLLADGGEAVSVDSVEVVLVGDS